MRMLTTLVFTLAGTIRRLSLFLLSGVLATSFVSLLHGAVLIDMCRLLDAGGSGDVSRIATVLRLNSAVWFAAYVAVIACDVLLCLCRLAVGGRPGRRGPMPADAVFLGMGLQLAYLMFFGLHLGASPATLVFDGTMTVIAAAAIAWLAVTPDARTA